MADLVPLDKGQYSGNIEEILFVDSLVFGTTTCRHDLR